MITFQHLGHCIDNKLCRRPARPARPEPSGLSRSWHWLLAASAQKTTLLLAARLISLLSAVAIG